jgi:hypothetical protein
MSNPQQPPADGWQPPSQSPQEPPVYRPDEQPPASEGTPPWVSESQRLRSAGQPMTQQPVEDFDGTVKYSPPPNQPFSAPPGVPVSPFDAPPPHATMPVSGPIHGPVSAVPTSAPLPHMSPGQGQFGPQGGQLVPMSGGPGGAWGGAQPPAPIQRKTKKKGNSKAPMLFLLIGIVVIAGALGVGGWVLFNPNPSGTVTENPTTGGTIEPTPVEAVAELVADDASQLKFVLADSNAWSQVADAEPAGFATATGRALAEGGADVYVGSLDMGALGVDADAGLDDVAGAFNAAVADHLGGEIAGEPEKVNYRVDARTAQFYDYTVGDTAVAVAVIEIGGGEYAAFAGLAEAGQAELVDAVRSSLRFGGL